GTMDGALRQMLHQADEEGQVLGMDALLIQGEDEGAPVGLEIEIGVLDAFGDALERQGLADIVLLQQPLQVLETDFGIDSHLRSESGLKTRQGLAFLAFYAFHPKARPLWSAAPPAARREVRQAMGKVKRGAALLKVWPRPRKNRN